MELNKFEIEFVERTRDFLKEYSGEYDMSIIINCTLGLIFMPNEKIPKANSTSFWDTEIDKIPNLPSFQLHIFKPIKRIKKQKIVFYPKTLKVLLKKIRNGLAHQRIQPINENGKFTGVVIRNYFNQGKYDQDLEISFSQQELKDFALFVADEYLRSAPPFLVSA